MLRERFASKFQWEFGQDYTESEYSLADLGARHACNSVQGFETLVTNRFCSDVANLEICLSKTKKGLDL